MSRKGSVKYSSGAPSLSTASTSSSAVTLLTPVSMADTVWRSLNPNISAKRSCESLRSSRSAPDPPADQLCRHWHLRTYSCTFQCASVICDLCTARNIPEVSSATARSPPRSGAVPNARIRRRPGGSLHAGASAVMGWRFGGSGYEDPPEGRVPRVPWGGHQGCESPVPSSPPFVGQ